MLAPTTKKAATALVLALALVYVLAAASSAPPGDAGSVTNESVSLQAGAWVELERGETAYTSSNLTVRNASTGATYTEGTDYEYNASALTVKALAGGEISDGETVLASYDYRERSETHRKQTDALTSSSRVVSLGLWGLVAAILVAAFKGLSDAPVGFK